MIVHYMFNTNMSCIRLTVVEIEFLQEYCKTMKPLSRALDILQSEKSCFMGFLLPTLYELCNKLEKVQLMLNYCGPLASAILHGIHVRFESMMTNSELIAAAILIPQFKTQWTSKRDAIEKGNMHFNDIAGSILKTNFLPSLKNVRMYIDQTSNLFFFSVFITLKQKQLAVSVVHTCFPWLCSVPT